MSAAVAATTTTRSRVQCARAPSRKWRARVWFKAWHLFSRAQEQPGCWLWLLDDAGAVYAVRAAAAAYGRDDRLAWLLARLELQPDMPISGDPLFGTIVPLPGAPAVPQPRWSVSWGHPLQQEIRRFAEGFDSDVLAALGRLEMDGRFYGSVANYNRLALLPDQVRQRRIQALDRFPPLVAPLL
ncbi:MAG: hypothetical protein L0H70_08710, partial [Xanthomonadales bacterium]|nr:hypothetical protein [Xanthomonadales bacterium]